MLMEHSHVISETAPQKYQSTKVNAKHQFWTFMGVY